MTHSKPKCFFCKYEIKSKTKIMNYKNTTVKVCSSCNSKKLKACSKNYQDKFLDCSLCEKAVIYNSSILCSICDHFVHQKCTKLTKIDINNIENSNTPWSCDKCCCDIFPFFHLDATKLDRLLNSSYKPPHKSSTNPKI